MQSSLPSPIDLVKKHSLTKACRESSKKWWDKEVDEQLRATRRAPCEKYKEKAKALQKFIRREKREGWKKFLEDQKHRNP